MPLNTKTLIARQGERWDQLCYRAYGKTNQDLVTRLASANRTLSEQLCDFEFSGAELVAIPDLPLNVIQTKEVAPWEQ